SAFDAVPNESAQSSPPASATTSAGGGTTTTFVPVADAYVDPSSPTTNYGANVALRVDGSPIVTTYVKFNLTGLTGAVSSATLRVYANSAQSIGYDVYSVSDTTWTESGLTANNAPPPAGTKTGSSG